MAGAGSIPRANWRRRSTARASALSSLSAAPCRWSSPGLFERIEACLAETKPSMVIALGLWPGEPTVRLERLAVNLADCTSPDNAGALPRGELLDPNGAPTLSATLPLRAIDAALLAAGIPARLSDTAGTFLCNATLYTLLRAIERRIAEKCAGGVGETRRDARGQERCVDCPQRQRRGECGRAVGVEQLATG